MRVYIGSRNRLKFPAKKIFGNKIVLFIEPQFIEEYKKEHSDLEIVDIKENDKGFGFMLNSMLKYAKEKGEKYFLFSDDDIYGLKKRKLDGKLEKMQSIDEFLLKGESIIDNLELAQLGVSFQGHNWYYQKPLKINTAVWGMGFMNAEAINKIGGYDENLAIFNDYEITARLLLAGYKNAVWYDYAFEHKMRGMPGGVDFIYKQKDKIDGAVFYLIQKYPNFTKVIKHEGHQINEVRFNWRKICQKIYTIGKN
jgi:hypothetical protein